LVLKKRKNKKTIVVNFTQTFSFVYSIKLFLVSFSESNTGRSVKYCSIIIFTTVLIHQGIYFNIYHCPSPHVNDLSKHVTFVLITFFIITLLLYCKKGISKGETYLNKQKEKCPTSRTKRKE